MMPYCEYHKCNKVAENNKIGLLRTWDTYDFRERPGHTQGIWLCKKHIKKLCKQLGIKEGEAL